MIFSKSYFISYATLNIKKFGDIVKYESFDIWKEAIFQKHEKNYSLHAFSILFLVEDIITDSKILSSLLVPQIKADEFHKDMHNFKISHTIDGCPQIILLEDTYYYIVLLLFFRITIALSANHFLQFSKLDALNDFQNSIIELKDIIYITLLSFYLEWYKYLFSTILLPVDNKFVIKTLNAMQVLRNEDKIFNYKL